MSPRALCANTNKALLVLPTIFRVRQTKNGRKQVTHCVRNDNQKNKSTSLSDRRAYRLAIVLSAARTSSSAVLFFQIFGATRLELSTSVEGSPVFPVCCSVVPINPYRPQADAE